jgi:hypothetical protein
MDIARLGVVIDPTPAEQGAARVKKALADMGNSAGQEVKKTEQSGKAAGEAVKKLGQEADQAGSKASGGFRKLSQAAASAGQDVRGSIMNALDSMGLMDGRLGGLIRRADAMARTFQTAKGLAGPMREASGAADGLAGSMGRATGAAGGLRGALPAIAVGIGAVAAAALAATAVLYGLWKAFQAGLPAAAKFEQYQNRISFAMGSWEKGAAKFQQLKKFAADTPFSDDDVFAAGTALQTMTKGVLTTEEALKAIGGSAAQAGSSFKEMAESVGVVFNGLQNGGDVIEYLKTMMNKGVIDGATLQQIRKLGEEAEKSGNKQANAAKQWELVYADLKRNIGALDVQARSWDGLMATMSGNWDSVKASFAAPIMIALKPVLQEIIKLLGELEPIAASAGRGIATAVKGIFALFKSGELFTLIVTAITDAFLVMPTLILKAVRAMAVFLSENLKAALRVLGEPESIMAFVKNMVTGLLDAAKQFGQALLDVGAKFIEALKGSFAAWWNSYVASLTFFGKTPFSGLAMDEAPPTAIVPVTPDAGFINPLEAWNMVEGPDNFARTKALLDTGAADFDANYGVEMPELTPNLPADLGAAAAGMGADAIEASNAALERQTGLLERNRSQLATMAEDWSNVQAGADQALMGITQSISGGLSDAISSVIMGTKSWGDAFREVGNMILESIIKMITQMWVQYTVGLMLKSVMGWGGAVAGSAVTVMHNGGTVGDANTQRAAAPAMRMHSGGMASSEQPAILEKGETVLTRQQTEGIRRDLREPARQEQSGGNLTIVNVTDSKEILDVIARNPEAIVNAISRQAPKVRAVLGKGGRGR